LDKKTVFPEPMRIKNCLKQWKLIAGTLDERSVLYLFDKDVTVQEEVFEVLIRAVSEVTGQVFSERLPPQDYIDEIRGCFENIIKQMPCYVYWKDKHFHYIFCNDITAEIMGLKSADEAIGKTDYDFGWDKELVDTYRETDKKIIMTGEAVLNLEEELIDKEGRIYQTLVNKMPLKNKKGEIIGLLGITVDITGIKKADIAKADFISNMEHDLKTPFSGIGGIANFLYDMETDETKKELLSLMVKSCTQWEQVHHRIFDALAVEHSQGLQIETVSIANELAEIKDMMAATVYMKKIAFEVAPVPEELDNIKTDRIKFRLILSSLISNAINFTEQGKVTVITSPEGDGFKIQVTDTGIGIPADKLDYVFERFAKLSRSNKYGGDFKGLGLGLYVCREYAKQLGATIQVESKLGEGSIFTVQFLG
jgi:two-component system, OmpR family, aerobic respiration control sensor histidine kinase ArcB